MNCYNLKYSRPVSNLTYLSKIIERAVAFDLNKYLFHNYFNEKRYSALKTEISLVQVKICILILIEQAYQVLYIILDLFDVFDRVANNTPFSRLKGTCILSDLVLEVFQLYLEQNAQKVSIWCTSVQVLLLLFSQFKDM